MAAYKIPHALDFTIDGHFTAVALIANFLPLVAYQNVQAYKDRIDAISIEMLAVWGWVMFIVHTLLTGIIATRIM